MQQKTVLEKYQYLKTYLHDLGSIAVAFSGGVDSTFLLKTAHDVLGDRAVAVTASSGSFPVREQNEASDFCRKEGIRQIICPSDELQLESFRQNPKNRCYICKKHIFSELKRAAASVGIEHVAEGSNMDDLGDYRPGLQAVAELGILSPLRMAELTKEEIRSLSRMLSLPTWDKPSYACLASRFVYGEEITAEKLHMVDLGEQLLMNLGFRQMRVRIHGTMARIEVMPEEFDRIMEPALRERIVEELKSFGFSYVTMDLQGYRTGSMNEVLGEKKSPNGAGKRPSEEKKSPNGAGKRPSEEKKSPNGAGKRPSGEETVRASLLPETYMNNGVRTAMLFGLTNMERFARARVAVFGVGGVGGYTVEALARSGIGTLDLIDSDTVSASNINRQIFATVDSVGRSKVEAARDRVHSINPNAVVNTYPIFFVPETADQFDFAKYDYIVDAIDTVTGKLMLVEMAARAGVPIISSMGAGNKMDPTMFRVADIYKTNVCPLAKTMRRELKKRGIQKLKVVYSEEKPMTPFVLTDDMKVPEVDAGAVREQMSRRATPGSNAFVPSVVGLIIAGEVLKDLSDMSEWARR